MHANTRMPSVSLRLALSKRFHLLWRGEGLFLLARLLVDLPDLFAFLLLGQGRIDAD